METVNRIVVSGLVFGPVEFTEPDRGPAHAMDDHGGMAYGKERVSREAGRHGEDDGRR